MNKLVRKAMSCALAFSAMFASVGMMTACETKNPNVEMVIEFEEKTYTLEYKLYRKITPATVDHFLALVENGYYNDICIHDYDTSDLRMYTGAYKYVEGEENGGIVYQQYYDIVKGYKNFPCSVWSDSSKTEARYNLYGEFAENGVYVGDESDSGSLSEAFGSLVMYYTPKDCADKVAIYNEYKDKMELKGYQYNSATSMFGISLSKTEKKNSEYCTFATLTEDSEDEFEALVDAIAENDDFTTEYEVDVDRDDDFVKDQRNKISYKVPNKPIVIKSMKVTKY